MKCGKPSRHLRAGREDTTGCGGRSGRQRRSIKGRRDEGSKRGDWQCPAWMGGIEELRNRTSQINSRIPNPHLAENT